MDDDLGLSTEVILTTYELTQRVIALEESIEAMRKDFATYHRKQNEWRARVNAKLKAFWLSQLKEDDDLSASGPSVPLTPPKEGTE